MDRLTHAVECRGNGYNPDVWEIIAAFNCEVAARVYAEEAIEQNGDRCAYRVVKIKKR